MLANLGDILKSKRTALRTIGSADTVTTAVNAMAEQSIGALPVIDNGVLVGIFSERDVLKRLVNNRLDPDTTKVAEVMSPNPVTATREMKVFEAMRLMDAKQFRHLPVVEGGRLISIVSMRDIAARIISDQEESMNLMINAVKTVSGRY
jgi:CBS domain-containing protein